MHSFFKAAFRVLANACLCCAERSSRWTLLELRFAQHGQAVRRAVYDKKSKYYALPNHGSKEGSTNIVIGIVSFKPAVDAQTAALITSHIFVMSAFGFAAT